MTDETSDRTEPLEPTARWKLTERRPEPMEVPDQVGRYEVQRRLGSGLHGTVLLATDPTSADRPVAIKVFDPDNPVDEADKLLSLSTRLAGLATVLDQGTMSSGHRYVVMEYFERGSLADRMDDLGRPATASETLRLIDGLTTVLHQLHSEGLVHRDVKPANLLLRKKAWAGSVSDHRLIRDDEELVLADFATVGDASTPNSLTEMVATAGYADPQVLNGVADTQGPAGGTDISVGGPDIYGASALVVEALSGVRPRQVRTAVDSPFAAEAWAATGPFEPALRRGLAFDATMRPASIIEWRTLLNAAAEPKSWFTGRRMLAAAALILLITGLGGAWAAARLRGADTAAAPAEQGQTVADGLPDTNDVSQTNPAGPGTSASTGSSRSSTTGSPQTISGSATPPSSTTERTTTSSPSTSTAPPTTLLTEPATASPSVGDPPSESFPNPIGCSSSTRTVFWFTKVGGATNGDGRNVYGCGAVLLEQPVEDSTAGQRFHLSFERCWADSISVDYGSDGTIEATLSGDEGTCSTPSSPTFLTRGDGSASVTITATRSAGAAAYWVAAHRS